jgi:predicted ATP-binding protein involved in virulence
MLKTFTVKGLYGLFSYQLTFKKGVCIITGPNGFGKTTILRCINDIYNGEFWRFFFLKFSTITVRFDDENTIELHRYVMNKAVLFGDPLQEVTIKVSYHGKDAEEAFDVTTQYISRLVRYQTRRDPSNVEEYLDAFYDLMEDEGLQKAMPKLLTYLHNQHCTFVGSQRLVYGTLDSRGNQTGIAYTIDDINEQIKKTYLRARNDFSKKAQSIDGTFIERLSKAIENKLNLDKEVSASELQKQIQKYRRYHLIEEMNVEVQLPKEYYLVENLYLNDIKSKLQSLEKYYDVLSAFDSFVTGQGLSYKHIELNESGINVLSDIGDSVPLNKLSSGEQNLMILAYNLIFETSNRDVLLVDEPENSLHMAWLENLLEDYIKIAKISGAQVIIATHSPTFIGSREDLVFDLFDNNN